MMKMMTKMKMKMMMLTILFEKVVLSGQRAWMLQIENRERFEGVVAVVVGSCVVLLLVGSTVCSCLFWNKSLEKLEQGGTRQNRS